MDELVAFLRARIDEDEAWIRGQGSFLDDCQECSFGQQPESPFSTARMLREVEAKRRLLGEVLPRVESMEAQITGEWGSSGKPDEDCEDSIRFVRLLALPYAAHSDYDPAWAPA